MSDQSFSQSLFTPPYPGVGYGQVEYFPMYDSAVKMSLFAVLIIHIQNWVWHKFNPHVKHKIQLFDPDEGTYELVSMSDKSMKDTAAVYHSLPRGSGEFRTKDLFVRHAMKPNSFKYYGRKNDIFTLSNGEKFNPVPLEPTLVIGNSRPEPALLVEFVNPKSNILVTGQGRIHRGMAIVASPDIPFTRTGKGTIVRRLACHTYKTQVEKIYADFQDVATISTIMRRTLSEIFLAAVDIGGDRDFHSLGLESIQIIIIVSSVKRSLQAKTPKSCGWVTPRPVFLNPKIRELSGFLYGGTTPNPGYSFDDVTPTYLISVVGSTGFLGSKLSANMLLDPAITFVYCLTEDLVELDEQGLKPLLHKLEYFNYEQLLTNVNAVVFNAWKLDFGLGVRLFHPFLHSIMEVFKLANESNRRMSILFVSSLSSVGNLAMSTAVPEATIQDSPAAAFTGYAQSKLAAERILTAANDKCGIPVYVARSWLSAIMKTAKTLNSIPTDMAMIDWLHKLKSIAKPTVEDVKAMPAPAILDIFDGLTSVTGNYAYAIVRSTSASSVRLSLIGRQFIEKWFGD
ncbi:NAD(P)-binding protein [Xylaria castorea]|nr:NAD(P)-binding protein [Xylaria castorea]